MVGFSGLLLFLFVPETFWDRTPRPKSRRPTGHRTFSNLFHPLHHKTTRPELHQEQTDGSVEKDMTARQHMLHEQNAHARFEEGTANKQGEQADATDEEEESHPSASTADQSPAADGTNKADHAVASTDGATDGLATASSKQEIPQTGISKSQTSLAALPKKKSRPTGLTMPPTVVMPPSSNPNTFTGPWDGTQNGKPVAIPALPAGFMAPQNLHGPGGMSSDTDSSIPHLHNLNSPYYVQLEKSGDYLSHHETPEPQHEEPKEQETGIARSDTTVTLPGSKYDPVDIEKSRSRTPDEGMALPGLARYTTSLRRSPPKGYVETLRLWNGRLNKSSWFLVALRPFILFAYPSILWSALVYSLSIGWLIVLSESISNIYKSRDTYNFTALQAGLVYVSPFIGGILGTVVAGKVSDVIVRYMARKNGGVYEPEFRLVMAIPVAISTTIGLMGFGWSAEERDLWIVPTIFFGVISFGCSLGSTTAITFCVDSYRQFAGEALVTLNFSKNIFHGLVFSLFFANWLESDGPKSTFLAIGGIQIACMFLTIPMYIYGKRARMWTVRKGFMEKF